VFAVQARPADWQSDLFGASFCEWQRRKRGKSGRGLPQSKRWWEFGRAREVAELLECANPLALWDQAVECRAMCTLSVAGSSKPKRQGTAAVQKVVGVWTCA